MPLVLGDSERLFHLDLETTSLRELPSSWVATNDQADSNLACDPEHLLAVLENRLVRLNLHTLEEQVLFP